jgi:ATP-dependent DNA helicase PIF1
MSTAASPISIFEQIKSFIDYTNKNIFLTGKAGTGKTTLLRQIVENGSKKMVIVAPTGVAAMNAKGTTINSFFQLPPGSFFPGELSLENLQSGFLSIESVVASLSYSRDKLNVFRELQLLIIDEISMVRCDLMDMIDAILKAVRKDPAPFGGVQLLLIGDLYQLPPVIKREDWSFLNKAYASPYFFESLAIRRHPLLQIELTEVFRQTEPEFINILNDIRNNRIKDLDLELLNRRYQPDFTPHEGLWPIIITSHNAEANAINKGKLDELSGDEYTFEAELSGEFREVGLQAEQTLRLKADAQIMFIKNDTGENRKYYNGKIGVVKAIGKGEIIIGFPGEPDLLLEKSVWQAFEYKADAQDEIIQQQVGEFSQYPIKLAWAVTIHKSQGLTFDSAIIDAAKSFVPGQVYVALSRVRTLNGLILRSRISTDSLRANPEVVHYMKPSAGSALDQILISEQEKYILKLILNYFSFQAFDKELEAISADPEIGKAQIPEVKALLVQLRTASEDLNTLTTRFKNQLSQTHDKVGFTDQQQLQNRIESAVAYFIKECQLQLSNPINRQVRIKPKNKIQQQVQQMFQKLRQLAENQISNMQFAATLLKVPIPAVSYTAWIIKEKEHQKVRPASASGSQQASTLQLF